MTALSTTLRQLLVGIGAVMVGVVAGCGDDIERVGDRNECRWEIVGVDGERAGARERVDFAGVRLTVALPESERIEPDDPVRIFYECYFDESDDFVGGMGEIVNVERSDASTPDRARIDLSFALFPRFSACDIQIGEVGVSQSDGPAPTCLPGRIRLVEDDASSR